MRMTQQRPCENGGGGAREAERSKPGKCGHSLRPSECVDGCLRTLASGPRGTGAHDVMAGHRSPADVSAALGRRRGSRAGSAPGEGAESTGSTTTHLRTTHDRERLCARSGCGRKNDVRHDDYPKPRSPEQCKPAMCPMMRASHRRITVEPIRETDTESL